jgi:hypothetical protein
MFSLVVIMLVKYLLEWDIHILLGVLPPLVLKVWEMAFHSIQVKDDDWVNLLYSMVEILWTFKKSHLISQIIVFWNHSM